MNLKIIFLCLCLIFSIASLTIIFFNISLTNECVSKVKKYSKTIQHHGRKKLFQPFIFICFSKKTETDSFGNFLPCYLLYC